VGDAVVDLEAQPGREDVVHRAAGEALDDALVLARSAQTSSFAKPTRAAAARSPVACTGTAPGQRPE
jgi:hypothetical protein